jgi:hypothetical protein
MTGHGTLLPVDVALQRAVTAPEGVIRGSRHFVSHVPYSGHYPDTALKRRLTMV